MRLALLNNLAPHYRMPVYRELARRAGELGLFLSERVDAAAIEETIGGGVRVRRSRGLVLGYWRGRFGKAQFTPKSLNLPLFAFFELARHRPDAVVSTEMGLRSFWAVLWCRLLRRPVAVWWGGTLHTEAQIPWFKRLLRRRFFARVVPAWVSYGTTSTEYLLSLGVGRDRVFEATNCVDNERFLRPAPAASPDGLPPPVFLYVGQFIARKGLSELLRAAAALRREGFSFGLRLVGAGPAEAALKAEAARLALDDVEFHPFASQEELPSLYRGADLFVFPTLEDCWGLVVNEALLCGLPALCSRYAGCAPDLVAPEWTFDPLDVAGSFAPAMRMAIEQWRAGTAASMRPDALRGPAEAAESILAALEWQRSAAPHRTERRP